MAEYYKGQCLCGGIQYEVTDIESKMAHCHCSMCQKFHGSAFSTFGEVKRENFRWLKGQGLLKGYTAENGAVRQFCRICGSSMTFSALGALEDTVEFSLGTLDDEIKIHPDAHVFVESKASWVKICDDLPQFKKGRES